MKKQIWLVCGGRNFGHFHRKFPLTSQESFETQLRIREYQFIMRTLEKLSIERSACFNPDDNWLPEDIEIVNGGSTGADSVSSDWAINNWCVFREHAADWARFGTAAGPIRNQAMLDDEKPDLVIAFPGGNGTADMVRRAKNKGVEVLEFEYDGRS